MGISSITPALGSPLIRLADKIFKNRKGFHFEKINDCFYRGSQAGAEEMEILAKQGVKRILNLKTISPEEAKELAKEAWKRGLEFINIPLNPFNIQKTFPNILKEILGATKEKPLYIHCTFGKDRTGFVSALARHIREGLPIPEAIKDMEKHGYRDVVFFHMKNFLKSFAPHSQTELKGIPVVFK